MKKKRQKDNCFMEEYWVTYDEYHKDTDTWEISKKEEDVYVRVRYGVNEKNNHDKARKIFHERMLKQGRIVKSKTVIYV